MKTQSQLPTFASRPSCAIVKYAVVAVSSVDHKGSILVLHASPCRYVIIIIVLDVVTCNVLYSPCFV